MDVDGVEGGVEALAGGGSGDGNQDGIPDKRDACPREPEDLDGFQDEDGCPDLDNDGDMVFDEDDRCPDEPAPEYDEDGDGCP